jgi:hypothetical protein
MSQAALAMAARDILRTAMAWDANTCELMFDGQPPPMAGQLFAAVHPGDWRGQDIEGLQEVFGFMVTVTRRASYAPVDRGAVELWAKASVGLEAICRNAANAYIGAGANGFVVPPRLRDGGKPQDRGPEWFWAEGEGKGKLAPAGISQTLTFGGAERYQTIESMT